MKILIFIEVDVVVRHFIHSGAFNEIAATHDVRFVFSELEHKRMRGINPGNLALPADYEHLEVEPLRTFLWKRLFLVDRLRWRFGAHWKALRNLHRYTMGWKASVIYGALGLPGIYSVFRHVLMRRLNNNPNVNLEALMDRERPDVIVHPCVLEGVYLNDLVEASNRREIPLVVIMNSWDNPSTKNAMIGAPNWLLVWGDQTKNHAVEYSRIPRKSVIPFGAAQFEVYRKPPRIDREKFLHQNNLPEDCPVLLYAGSSKGTSEIEHLRALERAIRNEVLPRASILYRPHPWGNGGEGGDRLLDEPWEYVYIESSMHGYLEQIRNGVVVGKYLSDYRNTHDVLSHIDALISPLSTIILEGAMHSKPVMCLMPNNEKSKHFKYDSGLVHFVEMLSMPEFLVAFGKDELISRTHELLVRIGDERFARRLPEVCTHFVKPFKNPYGNRLKIFLEEIVQL